MNNDISSWSFGLLFASLCALLGILDIVLARQTEDRLLASGQLLQGVVLIFVVAGAFFHRGSDLYLGGLVVVGLLIIQTLRGPSFLADDKPLNEEEST